MNAPSIGPLVVRSGRGPYAVTIAVGLFAASIYGLVRSVPSVNVADTLPATLALVWSIIGLLASTLVLVGLYWHDHLAGMVIERVGQVLISTGATAYVAVLCVESTFARAGLTTTVACSIAIASLIRAVQITIDLRRAREVAA